MKKKAIVTGATGFVGSNLCKRLMNDGWEVSIISRKSSDYTNLKEIIDGISIYEYNGKIKELITIFRKVKADAVFHLASLFIAEHEIDEIDNLIDSNLRFGTHILEAMKETETKVIINTGTSWQHFHSKKYNPVNLYAATKEAFEGILKYYVEAENIRAITLKLFDTYGETDRRSKLINLLNLYADERKELKMSPGDQVLDLVHVDDVTSSYLKAYDYLLENCKNNEIFGVSSGRKIRLRELIELFEKIAGKKLIVQWGGREYRKREVMRLWEDYTCLPNWEINISLEEGLLRYQNEDKDN